MHVLADILTREQQGWVVLMIALMCTGYLLFRGRLRKKDPLEKAPFSSLSSQRNVERQMQNLLVELSDMTRQMNAQIDTRAARLQELIKDADQRIETLRSLSGESPSPKPTRPVPVIPIDPAQDPAHDSAPDAVSDAVHDPLSDTGPIVDADPRHTEIYSLADEGCNAHEIARRLQRHEGEVELILALRQRV